ncbi:hypothetical protein ACET3Z_006511 [Daucus carota]
MAMETEFECYDYDKFALYDPAFYSVEENIRDEDFNLFHKIDRTLFYRLVRKLGRNVEESMFVVAFLIWLERIGCGRDAVHKVTSWPFHLLDQLANEIAGLSMWLDGSNRDPEYRNLYVLLNLLSRDINWLSFHEKRIKILHAVRKIVSEVCRRAFRDILASNCQFVDVEGDPMWYAYINPVVVPPPMYHNGVVRFPQMEFGGNSRAVHLMDPSHNVRKVLENPSADLSEIFGGMQLVDGCDDEPQVAPVDRTIFLTFSKGYYIAELELREFFTGIFGDFIEDMIMENVSSDRQPLYARMVCRSSSIIPRIAPFGTKTKYSINGKQVWAKKYERRSRASSSSGNATSE